MSSCQDLICIPRNSELLTLTYGALVSQMLKETESTDDVNKHLERIGCNMGVRLIEDFLARTSSNRCLEMRETADKIQQAFRVHFELTTFDVILTQLRQLITAMLRLERIRLKNELDFDLSYFLR